MASRIQTSVFPPYYLCPPALMCFCDRENVLVSVVSSKNPAAVPCSILFELHPLVLGGRLPLAQDSGLWCEGSNLGFQHATHVYEPCRIFSWPQILSIFLVWGEGVALLQTGPHSPSFLPLTYTLGCYRFYLCPCVYPVSFISGLSLGFYLSGLEQ